VQNTGGVSIQFVEKKVNAKVIEPKLPKQRKESGKKVIPPKKNQQTIVVHMVQPN
jgi:hypothetical protein